MGGGGGAKHEKLVLSMVEVHASFSLGTAVVIVLLLFVFPKVMSEEKWLVHTCDPGKPWAAVS